MKRQVFTFTSVVCALSLAFGTSLSRGQTTGPLSAGLGQAAGTSVRILPGSLLPHTVAFTLWNGVILIPAVVGDGVPIPAAINTGLPLSFVTPQLAAKQGIKPFGTREIDLLDHKITVASAPLQTVRFERMSLGGVPFGICDLIGELSGKEKVGPSIWLGSSALEGLCVTIDPQKSEITFRPANSAVIGKATRIPFALRDGRMWVDVVANDKQKFEALIDTGSVATLVPPKVAAALELKPLTTIELVDKNGKPGKVGAGTLQQLAIGKLLVKDVPVLFVTEGDPQGINQDFAVIGNDFLFRQQVTIDFGRKEISFEPIAAEPPKKEPKKPQNENPKVDKPAPPKVPDAAPIKDPDKKSGKPSVKEVSPKKDKDNPPPAPLPNDPPH